MALVWHVSLQGLRGCMTPSPVTSSAWTVEITYISVVGSCFSNTNLCRNPTYSLVHSFTKHSSKTNLETCHFSFCKWLVDLEERKFMEGYVPGVVTYTCNSSNWETEAGGLL